MEIAIRDWTPSDFEPIGSSWLAAYQRVAPPDAPLRHNAERVMKEWLKDRFHDRRAVGFVAEADREFAGFLLGRIGEWESDPPILKVRRIGLIDVVYVREGHRRNGIGTRLVRHVIESAELRGAKALETTFEVSNDPAVRLWHSLGFVPWIERAYRPTAHSRS